MLCVSVTGRLTQLGGAEEKKKDIFSNLLGQIRFFSTGTVKYFRAENNIFIMPIKYSDSLSTKVYLGASKYCQKSCNGKHIRAAEGFHHRQHSKTARHLLDIVLKLGEEVV